MPTVLHILTRPEDSLAQTLIARQQQQPDLQALIVDLTQPEPDYEDLLQKIFAADSVQAW